MTTEQMVEALVKSGCGVVELRWTGDPEHVVWARTVDHWGEETDASGATVGAAIEALTGSIRRSAERRCERVRTIVNMLTMGAAPQVDR